MPDLLMTFDRHGLDALNDQEIKYHVKDLEDWKKDMSKLRSNLPYAMDDVTARLEHLDEQIETEITLCKFYLEYNERKRSCCYFKRWIFMHNVERDDYGYTWRKKDNADAWLYTNGRILAIIEIITNAKSIKVQLRYRNDSSIYHFLDIEDEKVAGWNCFRKMESAMSYAEHLKTSACQFMNDVKQLICDRKELSNTIKFLQLLHLTQTVQDDEALSDKLTDQCFYCLVQNRPDEKCPEYVKRIVGECAGKEHERHEA